MFELIINIILTCSSQLGIIEDFIMTRILSEEKLAEFEQELEFKSLCLGNVTQNFNYYRANNGHDTVVRIAEDLKAERLKLEVQISTLKEYLEIA